MNEAATRPDADERRYLPPVRRIMVLVSSVLTVALYFTSILVASTVLPQMQGTFAATADEISWTMTFNILATAIAMPTTGWLATRLGRRRVMIWSTGLFTASTLMCGLAQSLEALVVWRIVQGAAGAPSVPLVQTIILDTFPPRQHRVVLGIYGMGVVLGPILGPTLGGFLADALNWRWAFFLLLPVGAIATLGLAATLPQDGPAGTARFSWLGFLLLSVAIGGLQWVLSRGQRLDWLESLEIKAGIVISATAFYLFLMHSLFASRPFLDLKLLTNRNYAIGLALIMLFGMLNFTPMVLLPTLMRGQMGFPDSLVGQVVGARGLGGLAGFFAVMFLARIDPRISVATGFGLLAFAGVWLMRIDLNVSALELSLNGIVQGLAAGIIVVALTLTTFTGMSREKMAEATAVYHLIRNIGASLFISVCVAEVVRSTGFNYARLAELVSPYNRAFAGPAVDTLFDVTSAIGLERISREISKQSAMIAYINAFGLFTAAAAVAMPLIMFLQRPTPGRS